MAEQLAWRWVRVAVAGVARCIRCRRRLRAWAWCGRRNRCEDDGDYVPAMASGPMCGDCCRWLLQPGDVVRT